jgi:sulfur carrier protein
MAKKKFHFLALYEVTLRLLINGENKEFSDGLSLEQLIQQLGVRKETVVAEVNRQIVRTDQRADWKLSDGDQVELIQFVGGG